MSNWTAKILDASGKLVFIGCKVEGKNAFYFLLLSNTDKNDLFEQLKIPQKLDLEKYGKIVRSGWGEPTEEDKEYMRKNYKADI
jgi:hypothetical protein